MTLREALAILRQQGLVETRRGRTGGTFIRRPTTPQVGLLRDRLGAMTTSALRDLADEQFAVSGAAAKLIFSKTFAHGNGARLHESFLLLSGRRRSGSRPRGRGGVHQGDGCRLHLATTGRMAPCARLRCQRRAARLVSTVRENSRESE
jgi:hypothetical protein